MIEPEARIKPKTPEGHGRPDWSVAEVSGIGSGGDGERVELSIDYRRLSEENEALRARVCELEATLAEARQGRGLAGQLVAAMNHDLRAPLHVIIGLAGILCDPHYRQSEQERVKSLQDIKYAGDHLLGLVNDILDLSRIEAGRLRLVPDLLHLGNLLERAADFMSTRAHEKGIVICPEVRPPDMSVYADERRLAEVAGELIDRLHADGPAALPPLPRSSPRRRAQTHSHTRNRRPDERAKPQPGRRTNGCGQGP